MSGIVSGISKVFTAVGNTAVRVGKAVTGVGAATFTAGAATGAKSIAAGGLSTVAQQAGGSVLGRVLTGAVKQAAVGALVGGAVGALSGSGFAKGALVGGGIGAVTGGLTGAAQSNGLLAGTSAPAGEAGVATAQTATGVAPTGVTQTSPLTLRGGTQAIPAGTRNGLAAGLADQAAGMSGSTAVATAAPAAAAGGGGGGGLMGFLGTETGGNLISGLGEGIMGYYDNREKQQARQLQAEEYDKQRAFDLDKEMRVRDSYNLDPSVLHGAMPEDTTERPTPAQAYGRTRYAYDPDQGRIVQVPA